MAAKKLLCSCISEWLKIVELATVAVVGLVEDERTFSNVAWMKNKVKNMLGDHLDYSICMFLEDFYSITNFPYGAPIAKWKEKDRPGVGF